MPSVKLNKETRELVERAYAALGGKFNVSIGDRATFVLVKLLEQWDIGQGDADEGEPAHLPASFSLDAAMREITEPNISLDLKEVVARHDKTTPRSVDGLVPWEYVCAGYSNIDFVSAAAKDYTDQGEAHVYAIRSLLTRIPEDQWESEQTRSIVAKALSQVKS